MIDGFYYLHTSGDLIFKRNLPGTAADIRESTFAVMLWPVNLKDRASAWQILVEALACGANLDRIQELATKWYCDNDDAEIYADRMGVHLALDGNRWYAARRDKGSMVLWKSPVGYGDTALEAMAALCKELGYKPQKMWGGTFADLLK